MTGEELFQELKRAAEDRGEAVWSFAAPLAGNPRSFLYQLRKAARPKPATLERAQALIEGRPVPDAVRPNIHFAGGKPGTLNNISSAHSLQRALEAKARVEVRRHLADQARRDRRPGETLASAVVRIERELRA